jgi:uncharacterized membrane protein (DUF373 family)
MVTISNDSAFEHSVRGHVVHALSLVEDGAYIGVGLLLAVSALTLLLSSFGYMFNAIHAHQVPELFVNLLDQVLGILLVIELLYTVQVSFREHGLVAEPFLVVALISVIRRVLVLTAEFPKLPQADESTFRRAWIELALLAVMTVIMVGSLILLQKHTQSRSTYAPQDLRKTEPG